MCHKLSIRGVRKIEQQTGTAISYKLSTATLLFIPGSSGIDDDFSSMPSNVISGKLKTELLNRDEGEPLLGAAKRSNYRLEMNFSANKSMIAKCCAMLAPTPSADKAHGKQYVATGNFDQS